MRKEEEYDQYDIFYTYDDMRYRYSQGFIAGAIAATVAWMLIGIFVV